MVQIILKIQFRASSGFIAISLLSLNQVLNKIVTPIITWIMVNINFFSIFNIYYL